MTLVDRFRVKPTLSAFADIGVALRLSAFGDQGRVAGVSLSDWNSVALPVLDSGNGNKTRGMVMKVDNVFLSVNAKDFATQSKWWSNLLGRGWDREPMPSCHEWDLREGVWFQVLDNPKGDPVTVTLHVADAETQIARLWKAGIEVPDPVNVEGFDTLRFAEFSDPEGNTVGLLDGE